MPSVKLESKQHRTPHTSHRDTKLRSILPTTKLLKCHNATTKIIVDKQTHLPSEQRFSFIKEVTPRNGRAYSDGDKCLPLPIVGVTFVLAPSPSWSIAAARPPTRRWAHSKSHKNQEPLARDGRGTDHRRS